MSVTSSDCNLPPGRDSDAICDDIIPPVTLTKETPSGEIQTQAMQSTLWKVYYLFGHNVAILATIMELWYVLRISSNTIPGRKVLIKTQLKNQKSRKIENNIFCYCINAH